MSWIVAAVKAAGQLPWWAIPVLSVPVIVALWVTVSHGARAGVDRHRGDRGICRLVGMRAVIV
ncbi:hypothetical protein IWGMT90018_19170 [Mycobacterium kiyosense]|nr:hypothetical protein IWGMT90018_19170 [Mycobacterium kiyosense]